MEEEEQPRHIRNIRSMEKVKVVKLEPTFYCTKVDECDRVIKADDINLDICFETRKNTNVTPQYEEDLPTSWIPDLWVCSWGHHVCDYLLMKVVRADEKQEILLSSIKGIYPFPTLDRLRFDAFKDTTDPPYPTWDEFKELMKKQKRRNKGKK